MPYISVQEAAALLAVKDETVRKWVKKGLLKGSKLTRIIRVEEASVHALLAANAIVPEERREARHRKPRPLRIQGGYRHLA